MSTIRSIHLSPLVTRAFADVSKLAGLRDGRALAFQRKQPLAEIMKLFENPPRALASARVQPVTGMNTSISPGFAQNIRKPANTFQKKIENGSIHLTPSNLPMLGRDLASHQRPALKELYQRMNQSILSKLDDSSNEAATNNNVAPPQEVSKPSEEIAVLQKSNPKKVWEARAYKAMVVFGELKQPHGEMVKVFEVARNRDGFLQNELFHFLKRYEKLQNCASDMSERFAQHSGNVTLPQLSEFIEMKEFNPNAQRAFLKELNEKKVQAENFLYMADIIIRKDSSWFKKIHNDNSQVNDCRRLFVNLEDIFQRVHSILEEKDPAIFEEHVTELESLFAQYDRDIKSLSKILDKMAPKYLKCKEGAVLKALNDVRKSPDFDEDPRDWKESVVKPCKEYFKGIRMGSDPEPFSQNPFLHHLLRAKKEVVNTNFANKDHVRQIRLGSEPVSDDLPLNHSLRAKRELASESLD